MEGPLYCHIKGVGGDCKSEVLRMTLGDILNYSVEYSVPKLLSVP